jgi:hypothetical protein
MAYEPTVPERTAEEKAAFAEVEESMTRAFDEARARLAQAGVRRELEQGSFCFKCSCEGFLRKDPLGLDLGGGDHPARPCLRGVCGHAFMSHYIY